MEADRNCMVQASSVYNVHDSSHFSSKSDGQKKKMLSISECFSVARGDRPQDFAPSYEMFNNLSKSVANNEQNREPSHSSHLQAKSFSSNDNVWLTETISNEPFLCAVDSFADANSSGLTDIHKTNGQAQQTAIKQQNHKLHVADNYKCSYQSDDGEMSEYDEGENPVRVPLGDSSSCNICGDVVAGFHCGAYVCEACKVCYTICLLVKLTIVFIAEASVQNRFVR